MGRVMMHSPAPLAADGVITATAIPRPHKPPVVAFAGPLDGWRPASPAGTGAVGRGAARLDRWRPGRSALAVRTLAK